MPRLPFTPRGLRADRSRVTRRVTGQILFPDTALRRPPQEPPRDDGAKCSLERRRAQRSSPIANIFAVSAGRPLFSVTIAELRHKLKQKSQGPRPFVVASACAARAGLQGPASSSPAKRQRAFLLRFLLPPV